MAAEKQPLEMWPPRGLVGHIHPYIGIRDLRKRVKSLSTAMMAHRTSQKFLVFDGVTIDDLAQIDSERASIGRHTRMSHYVDGNLLIIKVMPSLEHELAHGNLGDRIKNALIRMGIEEDDFGRVGSTRYSVPRSSKEGDTAYKPITRKYKIDWPTIVLESGFSEPLSDLRKDAEWWLRNSGGDVKIVILISIEPSDKTLLVEKWCLAPDPGSRLATRAHPNPNPLVPTRMQELKITQNLKPQQVSIQPNAATVQPNAVTVQPGTVAAYDVVGAPLVFEFENLLLRTPAPPAQDVVFTAELLAKWANGYWESMN
jgi:hypothetical protein